MPVTDASRPAVEAGASDGRAAHIVTIAQELLELLSGQVPYEAALITVHSPTTRAHRTVASVGCGKAELAWLDRWLVDLDAADTIATPDSARPLSWREDVVTLSFSSSDGRYSGSLHLFVTSSATSGAGRDVIAGKLQRVNSLVGAVVDNVRLPSHLTADMAASARGVVVMADSTVVSLPDRPAGRHLYDGGPLPAAITAAARRGELPERFRWRDSAGSWHLIQSRIIDSGYVITEDDPVLPYGLTARELDVLTLIARGYSNPQIAAILVVSGKTVAKHVEHVLFKLGCASRAAAAAAAVRDGLIELIEPPPDRGQAPTSG